MKKYVITQINEKIEYQCLIMATSHEDPLQDINNIELIEHDLQEKKIIGKVLFDMFAQIGDNSERFIELKFDGNKFEYATFNFVSVPKKSGYRNYFKEYFTQEISLLDNTVLNSIQKDLIHHGISI
ncbi:type II toxin-antitoxin system RnlB family antitoxin [Lysinibacillus sphaericus]|uniref:type II toxin-antitoxin system RnlB family antitoxin n=1 Tax=Lysinibacillus sphaericus TaxID=1421 RepID=UPI002161375F|nr:type II toxin-antitoxin system RnlB family antitoxin [Lysinibacillus sphaericus]MCS1382748.1 type II toxin-antitoxin system RnlB family antitoxin [Lysinibacillus sphaericus]